MSTVLNMESNKTHYFPEWREITYNPVIIVFLSARNSTQKFKFIQMCKQQRNFWCLVVCDVCMKFCPDVTDESHLQLHIVSLTVF